MLRLVLFLVLVVSPTWNLAQESTESEPSLAELARRERARRAQLKKTAPVITNATLKQKPTRALVSVVEAPPAPATGEAGEKKEGEGEPGKDLEALKAQFDEARLNYKNAVNRSMVLQLKMNDLRNAYLREDDGTTQARIQQQLQETLQAIEQSKQEIQAAGAELQKLENEAKAAGLPPGEIRRLVGELPKEETITTSPADQR